MLSNLEVHQFNGSNSELCESLGIQPSTDSPAHFYNYTARSVRTKAAAAIAAGKSDEPFEVKTARTAKTPSATAKTPSATATLPSELLAILPAVGFKLGTSDVKQFIKDTSISECDGESKLPNAVVDILAFFGISDELHEKLLVWAGVPTKRDFVAGKLTAAIAVLSAASNARFDGWTVEKMQSLLETLTAFALLSDSGVTSRARLIENEQVTNEQVTSESPPNEQVTNEQVTKAQVTKAKKRANGN